MNSYKYIQENIKKVEHDINEACIRYKRNRDNILLLPVSKNHDFDKIMVLYDIGYRSFAENRVQEMLEKIKRSPNDINWHLIGSLQTNKVKKIIAKTTLIHSLDRVSLLEELNRRSEEIMIITNCLLQINISKEGSKSGLMLEEVDNFLGSMERFNNIQIQGLMTIGQYTDDENKRKTQFHDMQCKFIDIGTKKMHNVSMKYLSMGMSNDYIEAIEFGSNILRIGTSIFGSRD